MENELREGAVGEYIAWNLFIHQKDVRQVIDVRDDAFFREVDVDFLIESINRQFIWVEVKTDSMTAKTGNIVFEKTSNKHYQTRGCLEKTKAQYIAYYVPEMKKMFLMSTKGLKEMADSGRYGLIEMGDDALGCLIPLEHIRKRGKSILIWEYDT